MTKTHEFESEDVNLQVPEFLKATIPGVGRVFDRNAYRMWAENCAVHPDPVSSDEFEFGVYSCKIDDSIILIEGTLNKRTGEINPRKTAVFSIK